MTYQNEQERKRRLEEVQRERDRVVDGFVKDMLEARQVKDNTTAVMAHPGIPQQLNKPTVFTPILTAPTESKPTISRQEFDSELSKMTNSLSKQFNAPPQNTNAVSGKDPYMAKAMQGVIPMFEALKVAVQNRASEEDLKKILYAEVDKYMDFLYKLHGTEKPSKTPNLPSPVKPETLEWVEALYQKLLQSPVYALSRDEAIALISVVSLYSYKWGEKDQEVTHYKKQYDELTNEYMVTMLSTRNPGALRGMVQ